MCPLPPVPFAQMCIQRKTLNKFIRDLSRGDDNPIPPDYPSRTAPSTKDAPIAPNPAGAVGLKRNKSRRARSTSSRSMPNTANPAAGASASASLSSALAHTMHAPPPDQVWGRKPELVRDKVREEAERAAASRGGRARMPSKRAREASGQEPDEEAPRVSGSRGRNTSTQASRLESYWECVPQDGGRGEAGVPRKERRPTASGSGSHRPYYFPAVHQKTN